MCVFQGRLAPERPPCFSVVNSNLIRSVLTCSDMTVWIDAHTHLDSEELFPHLDEVLQRALDADVREMLLVNSEAHEPSFARTMECVRKESEIKKHAAIGVHPHHASQYDENLEELLLTFLNEKGVIALGEIGLDFFYDFSPREVQIDVLERQLQLSLEKNLPVVIHCRDAYPRLAQILEKHAKQWRGMIHCFTGTREEAKMLTDLGFHISFSGIVTFRNADPLREAAAAVALDRILIETDAPYLAPAPNRGKINEPAFVVQTGRRLAEIRQMTEEELSRQIHQNFHALFQT